jgi:hypothetical protein
MIQDRELESWRAEWRQATLPLPEIHRKIKWQNRRFYLSLLAAAVAFVGALVLSVVSVRQEPSPERIAWAVGIWVLVFGCGVYRLWNQRGTWRPATQSTRAFIDLSRKRALAKIRSIRVAYYVISAWLIFCTGIVIWRWGTFAPDIKAHPLDYLLALGAVVAIMLLAFLYLAWVRRRKYAELKEAERLLEEMTE